MPIFENLYSVKVGQVYTDLRRGRYLQPMQVVAVLPRYAVLRRKRGDQLVAAPFRVPLLDFNPQRRMFRRSCP